MTLTERIKAAQQPEPPKPVVSPWVRRALEKRLPPKATA